MTRRKIVLLGGSNGAHVLAACLGKRGDLAVHLVTRNPDRWQTTVSCDESHVLYEAVPWIPSQRNERHEGELCGIHSWDGIEEALRGAEAALWIGPVEAHRDALERVLPALDAKARTLVGTLFAQGGFDWIARDVAVEQDVPLDRVRLFGLQHFPFLCKTKEPGRHVELYGRFPEMRIAIRAVESSDVARTQQLIADLFERPVVHLPSFLCCTLALSNQVLHPSISWGMLESRGPDDTVFAEPPLFYRSCTPRAAGVLSGLIADIRSLGSRLSDVMGVSLDKSLVGDPGIRLALGLYDPVARHLEAKASGIAARNRLIVGLFHINRRLGPARLPVKPHPSGSGYVANLESRFWRDDLPHGLCVLKGLASLVRADVPTIDAQILAHQSWMERDYLAHEGGGGEGVMGRDVNETNAPQRYGIGTMDALRSFAGAW